MAISGGMTRRTYGYASDKKPDDGKMDTYPASIAQAGGDYDALMARYKQMLDQPDNGLNALKNQYSQSSGGVNSTLLNYSPVANPNAVSFTNQNAPTSVSPTLTNGFKPISAEQTSYNPSSDMTGALGQLGDLARTGGYSQEDIGNLRARGVSPIRAVYSNAMNGLARNRSLQGGYSPGYAAAMSKMARELSETVAGQTTNVNAGIADAVARGRLSAAPAYASAAAGQQSEKDRIDSENASARERASIFNSQGSLSEQYRNADAVNRANEINSENSNRVNEFNTSGVNRVNELNSNNQMRTNEINSTGINRTNEINSSNATDAAKFNIANRQSNLGALTSLYQTEKSNKMGALEGMKSLYGTTPALPQLYGSQAAEAARLALEKKRQQQTSGGMLMNAYMGAPRPTYNMPGARF